MGEERKHLNFVLFCFVFWKFDPFSLKAEKDQEEDNGGKMQTVLMEGESFSQIL